MRGYLRMKDYHTLLVEIPWKLMNKTLEIPSPSLNLTKTFNGVPERIYLRWKSLILMLGSKWGFNCFNILKIPKSTKHNCPWLNWNMGVNLPIHPSLSRDKDKIAGGDLLPPPTDRMWYDGPSDTSWNLSEGHQKGLISHN